MANRMLVATRKGLFFYSRGAGGWKVEEVAFLGEPVTMTLPDTRDGAIYAVLTLGHFGCKLRRRLPGETEWKELTVPVFPEGAEVPAAPPANEGEPPKMKPASLSEIWALEPGATPGHLWAGTIPGAIFQSKDAGESWQLVEFLFNRPERMQWFGGGKDDAGVHSIAVDPRDRNRVVIAISCGGVWRSTDGGETWQNVGTGLRAEYMPPNLAFDLVSQDPHRIAACAAQPDTVWLQHHNGVFLSRDNGVTFTEIKNAKPAPFGFAVAAHPKDPDTAWFVPATVDQCRVPVDSRLVVSRTRDGGKSFEVLNRGLPEEPAYDIVYRHALDVDETGSTLAFGSTTGGLWVSENGGDNWTSLSHTLPPIYSIRFVP